MVQPGAEIDPIERYLSASGTRPTEGSRYGAGRRLATADASGHPSVRIVLLRQVDGRGFVFYTNYGSRKARELTENPRAALCQHWPTLEEQIRVEGTVELVDPAESDRLLRRPSARQPAGRVGVGPEQRHGLARPAGDALRGSRSEVRGPAGRSPALLGRLQDRAGPHRVLVRAVRDGCTSGCSTPGPPPGGPPGTYSLRNT